MKLNILSAEVKNTWNFTSTVLVTLIMNDIGGNGKSVVGGSGKLGEKKVNFCLMKQTCQI
jgi:hypothetical protein